MTSASSKSTSSQQIVTSTKNSCRYDIFISYHRSNQTEVIKLHKELVKHGYTVWLDLVDIKIGDNLNEENYKAIEESKLFLCCVCDSYLNSINCEQELIKANEEKKPIYVLFFQEFYMRPFNNELLAAYRIPISNVFFIGKIDESMDIDKEKEKIIQSIFHKYEKPTINTNFYRFYNCFPAVQAYRA